MLNEPVVRDHHVTRNYNEMCRNCIGTGTRYGETCPVCEGHGVVNINKEIQITIKPINPNKTR